MRRCSKSISRRGSAASSPIWSVPSPPPSIGRSARSVGCSSGSRVKHSRCRRDDWRARHETIEEDAAMKQGDKAKVGRREFLRALGAGAGAAAVAPSFAAEARADTENDQEKRKARYKESDHVKAYYR